ncbi:histidine phosphatase family protein [Bradyrhizobium sp. BRP14]|nr:histidine phosphatase family protein [Bradyrhizobium sp. BRP14]
MAAMVIDGDVDVFSSDLLRASQTAAIIAQRLQRPVIQTADLRESVTAPAGASHKIGLPSVKSRLLTTVEWTTAVGGVEDAETRREIATRFYRCVDSIVERACETQIIVTHGFALTFVIAAWIKMPIDAAGYVSFPARSGSITHLREDDFWRSRSVISLADISHLQAEATDD